MIKLSLIALKIVQNTAEVKEVIGKAETQWRSFVGLSPWLKSFDS